MLRFYQRSAPLLFRQTRVFSIKFAKSHEWVCLDTGRVGITNTAQDLLGELVHCDLPEVGESFGAGDTFSTVESVKAASDVYLPMSGEILEVNEQLSDNAALINEAAETDAWFARIQISDLSEADNLMDKDAYEKHCAEEEH